MSDTGNNGKAPSFVPIYRSAYDYMMGIFAGHLDSLAVYYHLLMQANHSDGMAPVRVAGERKKRPLVAGECSTTQVKVARDTGHTRKWIRRRMRFLQNLEAKELLVEIRVVSDNDEKSGKGYSGVYVKFPVTMVKLVKDVGQNDSCSAPRANMAQVNGQSCAKTTQGEPESNGTMNLSRLGTKHVPNDSCTWVDMAQYRRTKNKNNDQNNEDNGNDIIVSSETTFQNRVREVPTSGNKKPKQVSISLEEEQGLATIISWWDEIAKQHGMPLQIKITPLLIQRYRSARSTKTWNTTSLEALKTEITLSPYLQGKAGPETPVRNLPWLLQPHIFAKTAAGGYRPTTKQAQHHQQPQASTAGSNRGKTPEQMQEIVMQNYRYLEQQAKKFRAVMQQAKATAPMAPMVPNATEVPLKPPPLTQEQMNETWKQFR